MKRIILVVTIMLLAIFMLAPAGFAQEKPEFTVETTDSALEIMREKGPELYVHMSTYRGI